MVYLNMCVQNVVNKYKLENKFIAQTYDGASVMSGHLNGLQMKVQQEYPMALYTHCYAHVLNLVWPQVMAEISECNIFFSTLNGILTFFSHSSKRTFAIQEHSKKSTSVSVKHVFPIVFPNRRYLQRFAK